MPDQKPVYIARPTDPEAQRLLAHHERRNQSAGGAGLVFFILIIADTQHVSHLPGVYRAVVYACFIIMAVCIGIPAVRSIIERSRYDRAVRSGDIIQLAPPIITAFDKLAADEGLKLTKSERTEALSGLFDAAQDLGGIMSDYATTKGERRKLAKAQIRARVYQEIQVLKVGQDKALEIAESDIGSGVPGVSQEEVDEQLKRMPLPGNFTQAHGVLRGLRHVQV